MQSKFDEIFTKIGQYIDQLVAINKFGTAIVEAFIAVRKMMIVYINLSHLRDRNTCLHYITILTL